MDNREYLLPLVSKEVSFLTRFNDIDLRTIGDKKTAVFVCISDNDSSMKGTAKAHRP